MTRRGTATRAARTQPVPVGDIIGATMKQLTERHQQLAVVDFPTWKRIVGARTARHAQPTVLRRGRVTVRAHDSALLYELSLRSPELLAGLREALPGRDIQEISFSIGEVAW